VEHGYEVSSIHPNKTGDLIFRITPAGNRFAASDVSLFTLIQWAYKLQQSRISGAGSWTKSERFDIVATAPRALSNDQHRLMLQPLLADRFRLETRWETRRMPVYELSAEEGASKLKKSTCAGTPSGILGREVLNKTGIQGTYDFTLSWTPDTAVDGDDLSIFTAVREQLGMKLASATGSVEILVVVDARRPTPN
jgi:hypothetical protein